MRTVLRILKWVGILLLVVIVGAASYAAAVVAQGRPQVAGTLRVGGLREAVEVVRDRWGVPHIRARNEHDLFFAQGYVAAGERLFQMDFFRRVARGRLSEVFGAVTLDDDKFLRTIGIGRAADAEARTLGGEPLEVLQAFSDGVNAYVASRGGRLPVEFRILGYRFEPWSPTDTVAFGKLMAWDLDGNWEEELLRQALVAKLGPEAALLTPGYPQGAPTIVSAAARDLALLRAYERVAAHLGLDAPDRGSNNWVLAGSRTETGKPLLANDPHLRIGMPSIWYEVHLVGGRYDVIGAAFAAAPGVIIGHNDRIAWGLTNGTVDLQDLYVERLHPSDPTRYQFRGRWERMRVVREAITVKGRAQPVVLDVRITRHGPIISGVLEHEARPLALRWVALDVAPVIPALGLLDRARTFQEFRAALRDWQIAPQNAIYADVDGNIGYQLPGRIPIRARGQGAVPVPGWTGEYEWTGWIPFDAHPTAYNPSEGMIVTANNKIVPDTYPYFLAVDWDPGFRAARIRGLLGATPKHSVESFAAIQYDVHQSVADLLLPDIAAVESADPHVRAATEILRRWDRRMTTDSAGALLFDAVFSRLLPAILGDRLGPDLEQRYEGAAAWHPWALRALLDHPESALWNGGGGRRTPSAVIEAVLRDAMADLTSRFGPPERWRWGLVHRARFAHTLGSVPALGLLLNGGEVESPGSYYTVNNAGYSRATHLQRTVASYRQIVDLAAFDRSVSVHTTGQSGVPFTRHYKDLIALWVSGRYHPQRYSPDAVAASRESVLRLEPAR